MAGAQTHEEDASKMAYNNLVAAYKKLLAEADVLRGHEAKLHSEIMKAIDREKMDVIIKKIQDN